MTEKILYAVKIGEPDYLEQIITTDKTKFEAAKTWATANGFDRFRIATINLNDKPDFIKSISI